MKAAPEDVQQQAHHERMAHYAARIFITRTGTFFRFMVGETRKHATEPEAIQCAEHDLGQLRGRFTQPEIRFEATIEQVPEWQDNHE